MGKKRAAPVFPFPAAAAGEPDHFSDYGFDPQLVGFFAQVRSLRIPHLATAQNSDRLLKFHCPFLANCKRVDAHCPV
jgi:hypothetical protein